MTWCARRLGVVACVLGMLINVFGCLVARDFCWGLGGAERRREGWRRDCMLTGYRTPVSDRNVLSWYVILQKINSLPSTLSRLAPDSCSSPA